jgi:CotH kinase protein
VWDFNIAYGIGDYCEAESWAGWQKDFNVVCSSPVHFWWDRLWADDAFRVRMGARWREMRQGSWSTAAMMGKIDSIAALLQESQQRNFQRWPVLGQYVWPNSFIGQTYQQEVDFLKDWLYNRLLWLDFNYEDASYIRPPQDPGQPPFQVYPNPAKQYLHIKTTYDPRLLQEFSVRLYDAGGRLAYYQPLLSGKSVLTIELHEAGLPPGLYAYHIVDQLGKVWTGKVLVR